MAALSPRGGSGAGASGKGPDPPRARPDLRPAAVAADAPPSPLPETASGPEGAVLPGCAGAAAEEASAITITVTTKHRPPIVMLPPRGDPSAAASTSGAAAGGAADGARGSQGALGSRRTARREPAPPSPSPAAAADAAAARSDPPVPVPAASAGPSIGGPSSGAAPHAAAAAPAAGPSPPADPPGGFDPLELLARVPRPAWVPAWVPPLSTPDDRPILALAGPALLALAADPLMSFVDTAFCGHIGTDALAALGVDTAIFAFAFVIFNFLATATTPLVAAALAAGDRPTAGRVLLEALPLAGVLGLGVTAVLLTGSEGILSAMGVPAGGGQLHDYALAYLTIRAWAAPAVLLATVGQGAFRGLQDTSTPLAVTVGSNVLNLGLAPLLMFGLGWGVPGAAAACCASEWAAAAGYLYAMYQRREALGLDPLPEIHWQRAAEELMPFARAGGAVLLRTLLLLGTRALATAVATRLGPTEIAAHQVAMQLWFLGSLVVDSLAVSAQALVAVLLGAGDVAGARRVSDRLLQMGAALGLTLALVFGAGETALFGAFTDDEATLTAALALFPVVVAMQPLNALVYVLDGIFVGAADFNYMVGAMSLAAGATVGALLAVEPLGGGLMGVWGALATLMFGRCTTLLWRYHAPGGPLSLPAGGGSSSSPAIDVEPLAVRDGAADSEGGGVHPKQH